MQFYLLMDKYSLFNSARKTIRLEGEAVLALEKFINEDFARAFDLISKSRGRLVVSGIGKSAIIAQKLVATFNSTGTPALFMHAADAIHGDLGMVQLDDVVMLISKSGDSPEIKVLVPLIKNFGNSLIGMCGKSGSYLASNADVFLNTTVEQEACPHNLAPTTSTTAQLAMGDALAVCLMENRGFESGDFAKYHPGGALGKKLYLKVGDMVKADENPKVYPNATIREAIIEITSKRLGAAAVTDEQQHIIGVVTDGDIRRMMERYDSLTSLKVSDIMGKSPKVIDKEALAVEAFEMMKKFSINQLVVTHQGKYYGILHIQDLMREGII